jgi:hypothetical protein
MPLKGRVTSHGGNQRFLPFTSSALQSGWETKRGQCTGSELVEDKFESAPVCLAWPQICGSILMVALDLLSCFCVVSVSS